jgi:hypothetical protein
VGLKYQLENKPNDALLGDGLITGKPLRDHTRLIKLVAILITREGRHSLEPTDSAPTPSVVVHGDQFISHGNLGASGRNSSGTVVINQSWSQEEAIAVLDALLSRLQEYPAQTPDLEKAQREFHKVRDEITDEPSPDNSLLAKWLSRGKQLLATAALSQEVFEAAHKVYKLFGI